MGLENYIPCCEPYFWVLLTICVILLLFASITSGLALGLLSFNQVDLEVLVKSGQPQAQKNAAKILPLVKKEHLLLCTLLAGKTLALEALPIVLHTIFPTWCAIIISLILVLAFVEIIPQAVFSRYGLSVGAKLSILVQLLMLVFLPLSYPISKLLDLLLGREHSVLRRRVELKTLVDLHAKEAGKGGELLSLETAIIAGALDLTEKTAKDVMTPISRIFSLDINSKLTMHLMNLIRNKGHSRIPVYSGDPKNVIGLILVKNLVFCHTHPEDETPIKYMTLRRMPRVYDNWPLYDVLNQFLKGQSHMAVVVRSKKKDMIQETENSALDSSSMHDMNTNSNVDPRKSSRTGLIFPLAEKEYLSISTETSSLHSLEMEFQNKTLGITMEQNKHFHSKYQKSEREQKTDVRELMSFPSSNDDEIIGIITLEDVIEALLQENILDETDYAYIDVHNKITINPMHTKRWSSKSSRTASSPHIHRKNLETSLFSQTPKRRSQSFSYATTRPIIPSAFGKSVPNSPAAPANPINHHRISRMSNEEIQLHNDP